MGQRIRKCKHCGRYTLKEECQVCGKASALARPARFSLRDPYGKYRRQAKRG